jgi:hypothetical protein
VLEEELNNGVLNGSWIMGGVRENGPFYDQIVTNQGDCAIDKI